MGGYGEPGLGCAVSEITGGNGEPGFGCAVSKVGVTAEQSNGALSGASGEPAQVAPAQPIITKQATNTLFIRSISEYLRGCFCNTLDRTVT
jgi:hypothetical protein